MQHIASTSFLYHAVFRSLSNPVMLPSYSYQSCSLKQFQFPPCVAICFLTVLSFCVKSILNLKPSQAAVLDSTGWMKALFQTGKICYLNKANGLLEQQEKSSQKQVATFLWSLPKLIEKQICCPKLYLEFLFYKVFLLDREKGHALYLGCAWINKKHKNMFFL